MSSEIAVIHGKVQQEAFYFTLNAGGVEIPNMILDTGAFELTFNGAVARELNLPNLGGLRIGGVGGTATAHRSRVNLKLGTHEFRDVPCIVDPGFNSPGLFGLRFFIDNHLKLGLDPNKAQLIISKSA